MSRGLIRFSQVLLSVGTLLLLSTSCNKSPCANKSDEITCYFYDDAGNFVTTQTRCKGVAPECDCSDANGDLIVTDNGNDPSNQFDIACNGDCWSQTDPSICPGFTVVSPISVDKPYKIKGGLNGISLSNEVIVEFENEGDDYHYDNQGTSDASYRWIYVEFHRYPFVYDTEQLEFRLVKGSTVVSTESIVFKTCGCAGALRRFTQQEDTQGSGVFAARGTIKINAKDIGSNGPGTYQVKMVDVAVSPPVVRAQTSLNVEFVDPESYDFRKLTIQPFQTFSYDLSNHSIDTRSYEDGLDHVFGSGRSNIEITTNPSITISGMLVDSDDDALLDEADLLFDQSTPFANIDGALQQWAFRLYDEHSLSKFYNITTMITEVSLVKSYDFLSSSLSTDNTLFVDYAETYMKNFLGINFKSTAFANSISVSLVFRKPIDDLYGAGSFSSSVDPPGMALVALYHELGHAWGRKDRAEPSSGTDCQRHIGYNSGKGEYFCLWNYCDRFPVTDTAFASFFNRSTANPAYCEFHKQIFMNQLRPH